MKINRTAASPLVVTCALIEENGRILLAQRSGSGLWELPGGKVEPGEDLPACLTREIAEELGVRVEVTNALGAVEDHTPDGRPLSLHAFFCRIKSGRPRALEHRALAWHALDRALELDLCPADRRLLSGLINQEPK
jgi:mutator protein MutT